MQNQTWVFNYDRGGNITSRVRYAYTIGTVGTALETIPYAYGDSNWKDKLTAYNGKTITYDAIGNPLNDGVWSYEWQAGRQLKRMSAEGTALTFKYDHNGLRTQKVVEASWYPETTNYFLHGKLLTHMTVDYTDFDEVAHQDKLHFFYDAQSRPAQVNFNGIIYTYVHNLQGDVVGLLDSTGALVVEHKYDAWGKPISTTGNLADTLGKRNPFRYRGYIYDEETGLYYLRSRYYNPTVGRFVNADVIMGQTEALLTNNVYVYCCNNPLRMIDDNGNWPSFGNLLTAAFIAVTTIVVAAAVVTTAGAAGAAVGVAAGMYLGTSTATSVAIGTAATVGAYCVAGGVVACGVNDVAEQVTGTNVIANTIGSDEYEAIRYGLYGIAGASIATSNYGYESPRKKVSVEKVGKLVPSNHKDEGYYGVRYKVYKPGASNYSLRSIEFHTHNHHGYKPHWQLNYWNPNTMGVSGKKYWTWYGRRIQ